MSDHIHLTGVETHNLKNIDITFTKNKLTVVTWVSGSWKSSLAFTTLCAEGQRRYLESLSTYARMFVGGMKEEAKVREISGITPTISIDQKTVSQNPRSTVGTITEIYDYYRLLFLHLGVQHCPTCNASLEKNTKEDVIDCITTFSDGTKYYILAPILDSVSTFQELKELVIAKGFVRFFSGETVYSLSDEMWESFDIQSPHFIVIDRLIATAFEDENDPALKRLHDSISVAFDKWEQTMSLYDLDHQEIHTFSRLSGCQKCDYSPAKLTLSTFSFNSPHGACLHCHGLGHSVVFSEEKIVNADLTIEEWALLPWWSQGYHFSVLQKFCQKNNIPRDVVYKDLSQKHKDLILHSDGTTKVSIQYVSGNFKKNHNATYRGLVTYLEKVYTEWEWEKQREKIEMYASWKDCPKCSGYRVCQQALLTQIGGVHIGHIASKTVDDSLEFFENFSLSETQKKIADKILKNCIDRIRFLKQVGLGYIQLSRRSNTLSGGESQRIRLATQVGSRLEGITYVLDEPSIGLHPRDNDLLIGNLKELVGIGNTLVVVEHDEEIMREADEVIDVWPLAWRHGGQIVYQGDFEWLVTSDSDTWAYLSGKKRITLPENKRKPKHFLSVRGASLNNLKQVDIDIPLGVFVCVTGVSGSWKSSLINKTLSPYLLGKLNRSRQEPGPHTSISGEEHLDKAIVIDQLPIGKTPRSNPATYTGVFTLVREVFATLPESKKRGYTAGHFSFNTRNGCCEVCGGDGVKKVEMHFLPDMYVTCESCQWTRYNPQVRQILYKDKSISDILSMSVEEAYDFFEKYPRIKRILGTLVDVGLDYIHLGQSAITLSGWESQRVKLASELSKRSTTKTIYILDEPTTGLHFSDVQKLLTILDKLVEKGNSVLVVEHHLDVIDNADWIIDMGPEWGDAGGQVLYSGTKDKLHTCSESHTAQSLLKMQSRYN